MSETDPMNVNERRKYIHKMWGRYRQAEKKEKTRLLDEMEAVTGLHRKSILRTINGRLSRKKRSRERGREYGVEVDDAIRLIARSLDYPCAERLQPNLGWMVRHLSEHGELRLQEETLEKLNRVSISSVKRILKRVGRSEPKIASQKPKRPQSNSLRQQYPMSRIAWDIAEAGHLEVDLVHHCGESTQGEYIHSLIRAYLGHDRFDTLAHLQILRALDDKLRLYHNLFQPVMRLKAKEYLSPFKYRRTFDPAQPPLDRLIAIKGLNDVARNQLEVLRKNTNPLILRMQIDQLISQLLSSPSPKHSHTVNVFETLLKEADLPVQ